MQSAECTVRSLCILSYKKELMIINKIISVILSAIVLLSVLWAVPVFAADSHNLLFYDDFEDEYSRLSVQLNGSVEISPENVGGNRKMKFKTPEGEGASGYADAVLGYSLDNNVVVDVLITPVEITGGAYIGLFDAKDNLGNWRMGAKLNSNNTLTMTNSSWGSEYICNWTAGVELRYTVLYDVQKGTANVYINGGFVKEVKLIGQGVYAVNYRIDVSNTSGSEDDRAIAYFDNLKIYAGSEVLDDSSFDLTRRYSVMDYETVAHRYIGEASVFTDAKYYFINGEKKEYASDAERPCDIGGIMCITDAFAQNILKIDPASLSRDYVEGSYFNAQIAMEGKGLHYLYDKRGFFVLTEDNVFPYTDGEDFTSLFDVSDLIYRYVNFDNPRGEKILGDIKSNWSTGAHPRLIMTDADAQYVKNLVASGDSTWTMLYRNTIKNAESFLGLGNADISADCAPADRQRQSITFQSAIEWLSSAYILTGDEKYAVQAVEYMKKIANWGSISSGTSNLTTGHWSMGLAIGYDTFYNYMQKSNEGKETASMLVLAAKNLAFADTVSAYKGNNIRWININDNFQGVISGGVMALILAMADEKEVEDEIIYLSENVLRSMQLAVSLFTPDGGYYEGISYSEYMLDNLTMGITALFNCCQTDYGLGNAKGFSNAGDFFLYMQTSKNRFNFSDCEPGATNTMLPAFFARYYKKTDAAKLTVKQNKYRAFKSSVLYWMQYYKALELWGDSQNLSPELDKYFYSAEAGSFRNSFDTDEPVFAAFHDGRTGRKHDMLDTGEFVFEAGGVPWAIDLGNDSYELDSYFGTAGYKIYCKHTQGENCVLINPLKNPYNYFGQEIGQSARLLNFVSKPKGAFATIDLTNVYRRDVISYKRGYYFGDLRHTLTVQDEIKLKSATENELYWFMHTAADVKICDDGKSALLTSGQKSLVVQFYSNAPFTLSNMKAKPLEGTPIVSGQSANENISKLSLHFENATGDINISAKLIYQDALYTPEDLVFSPMDSWSVPDGEYKIEPVLENVYVDAFKNLSADVLLPADAKAAYILVNGEVLKQINPPFGRSQKLTNIDVSFLKCGVHKAELKIEYENNTEYIDCGQFFVMGYKNSVFYENNLAQIPIKSELPQGWTFSTGNNKNQGVDFLTLTSTESEPAVFLDFSAESSSYLLDDVTTVLECDVSFSSLAGNFNIACENNLKEYFLDEYTLMSSGKIYNGSSYSANTWYHIKLVLDHKSKLCSFYVGDNIAIKNIFIPAASSNLRFKMQYSSAVAGDSVSFKNFKVTKLIPDEEKNAFINVSNNGKYTAGYVYENSTEADIEVSLIVASYIGERLNKIEYIRSAVLRMGGPDMISATLDIDVDDTMAKVFVWNGMKPIATETYYNQSY